MNATAAVDVPRLIRIATFLFAVLAGTLVYLTFTPQIDAVQARLADAQATLASDRIAANEIPRTRLVRDGLAARYAPLFAQNAEAVFVRELTRVVARHGVTLVSTSVAQDTEAAHDDPQARLFDRTHVTVAMRGGYAGLLAAVGDLSTGSEIVNVEAPSLERDGARVTANVPVTIFEPARVHAP